VHEISASFGVPDVLASTSQGIASTWIGVDNSDGEFIQVGVIERADTSTVSAASPIAVDNAFWSDTRYSYHPRNIAPVEGGDFVTVKMRLQRSGWLVSFQDSTAGWSRIVTSHFGKGEKFQISEWTQEDPVASVDLFSNLPYPALSETNFFGIKVNGRTPKLSLSDGVSMNVLNGPMLTPTIEVAGRFSLAPPNVYQKLYLSEVAAPDHFSDILFSDLQTPSKVSHGRLLTDERRLLGALTTLDTELAIKAWPPKVERQIPVMIARYEIDSRELHMLLSSGIEPTIELRFYQDNASAAKIAQRVRKDLGLPPS
jgi:hypothetical protein